MVYKNLKLPEWISEGRANGTIQHVATVIWAYQIDEPQALQWVAEIVTGRIAEREALAASNVWAYVHDAFGDLGWTWMVPSSNHGNLTGR